MQRLYEQLEGEGYVFAKTVESREWDTPEMISVLREILQDSFNYDEVADAGVSEFEPSGRIVDMTDTKWPQVASEREKKRLLR